jgi:tetratricopeptide (TPR) repeat protein
MLATAYLWTGQYGRYAEILGQLGALEPKAWEDYLFLGAAMVAGHPDTARTVELLEKAKQMHASGLTFLQLAMAEGYHAQDAGSWEVARTALDHSRTAEELLGVGYPPALPVRLNVLNFALRLCPDGERAALREQAAGTARALASVPAPLGRMQRAFYFQITGDDQEEVDEWREAARLTAGTGLFASYYAAAMFARSRSREALDVLSTPAPSPDGVATLSRAYLLLDMGRPDDARRHYEQVLAGEQSLAMLAETVLLLAGGGEQVAANARQLLMAVPPGDLDYRAPLEHWAGRRSAEDMIASAGQSRGLQSRAHHLAGLFFLAQGDRVSARQHFERSVVTGTHWRTEHQWSRAFLARLEQDPKWPPWIPGPAGRLC